MLPHIQQLLTDLAHTPSLVCTVGRDGAVSELFLDGAPQKVEFADSWATVEFSGWHIHVDLSAVAQVRFAPATPTRRTPQRIWCYSGGSRNSTNRG